MNNSLPGNLFLTTSTEAIELFLNLSDYKVKLSDFAGKLTKDQLKRSVVCSPSHNSNLIDFEMNWNKDRQGYTSIFRFIETGSFFESQFIAKDLVSEKVAEILTQSKISRENRVDLEADAGQLIENPVNSRELYFTFGVGENLSNWAGPFVGVLISSEVNFSQDGTREIVLTFHNNEGKFLRNEIEGPNSGRLYTVLNKYESIYRNRKINLQVTDTLFLSDLKNENVHIKIKEMLVDYIERCVSYPSGNTNIVVILPDLEKLCKQYFDKFTEIEKNGDYEMFFRKLGFNCTKKFVTPEQEAKIKQQIDSIEKLKKQLKQTEESLKVLEAPNPSFGPIGEPGERAARAGESLLRSNIKKNNEESKKIYQRNLDVIQQEYKEEIKKVILEVTLKLDNDEKSSGTENTPDYYAPLQTFNNNLNEMYKDLEYNYDGVFLTENDLRVISLWNKEIFKNLPLDDKKTVFIFGDRNLIEDFLYVSKAVSFNKAKDFVVNKEFVSKYDKAYYIDGKASFREKMFLLKRKDVATNSFDYNKKNNNEFALDDDSFFDDTTKEMIKLLDCPIFRHNISNPNVLSLSVQGLPSFVDVYNVFYNRKSLIPFITDASRIEEYRPLETAPEYSPFAKPLLKQGSITKQGESLYDIVKKQVEKDRKTSPDINKIFNIIVSQGSETGNTRLRRSLADTSGVFSVLGSNGDPKLIKVDLSDNKLASIYTIQIYKKLLQEGVIKGPIGPSLEFLKQQEVAVFERDLFNFLCTKVQNVVIKTLPWFSINGFPGNMSCVLMGLQNIAGDLKTKQKALYTGIYFIKGYKHVITPTEMYSEFSLGRKTYDQIIEE